LTQRRRGVGGFMDRHVLKPWHRERAPEVESNQA
jgi:hypothetical protein